MYSEFLAATNLPENTKSWKIYANLEKIYMADEVEVDKNVIYSVAKNLYTNSTSYIEEAIERKKMVARGEIESLIYRTREDINEGPITQERYLFFNNRDLIIESMVRMAVLTGMITPEEAKRYSETRQAILFDVMNSYLEGIA